MENWQVAAIFSILGLLFLGSLAVLYLFYRYYQFQTRAYYETQTRISMLEQALAGSKRFAASGLEARQQYQARRQAAIVEAFKMYADKKPLQEIAISIGTKYPDVAAQVMQNPDIILADVKRLGLVMPPELAKGLNLVQGETKPNPD